jgi:ABC-type uncharacterized transport system YnjBCD substrate-binding protein
VPIESHASEQPLPRELVDYSYHNDGTIEELHEWVRDTVAKHYGLRILKKRKAAEQARTTVKKVAQAGKRMQKKKKT